MLKLFGVIAQFVMALFQRKWRRDDDPLFQATKRKQEADQAMATGDSDAVNRQLNERLSRPKNSGDPIR